MFVSDMLIRITPKDKDSKYISVIAESALRLENLISKTASRATIIPALMPPIAIGTTANPNKKNAIAIPGRIECETASPIRVIFLKVINTPSKVPLKDNIRQAANALFIKA